MSCLLGHKWNGCKCEICGEIRDKKHSWRNGVCDICGNRQDGVPRIKETYRQEPGAELEIKSIPVNIAATGECLFCGQLADYHFPAILNGFTTPDNPVLIGWINVHICKNCYSEKEVMFMKNAEKSLLISRILIAISMTAIISSVIGAVIYRNTIINLIAMIVNIGWVYAGNYGSSQIKTINSLKKELNENFFILFGDENIPNKTIEKQDVFFKYDLLEKALTNQENILRENVSENISLDSYSSYKIAPLKDFPLGLSEIEKNAVRDLMEPSN